MVLDVKLLIDAIGDLLEQRSMRVTLKESATGALICGISSFCGALIAGPVGLAVGGAIGSAGAGAYKKSKGKLKSVGEIIRTDLSDHQREKLLEYIKAFVDGFEVTDVLVAIQMLQDNEALLNRVQNAVASFVEKELKTHIVD